MSAHAPPPQPPHEHPPFGFCRRFGGLLRGGWCHLVQLGQRTHLGVRAAELRLGEVCWMRASAAAQSRASLVLLEAGIVVVRFRDGEKAGAGVAIVFRHGKKRRRSNKHMYAHVFEKRATKVLKDVHHRNTALQRRAHRISTHASRDSRPPPHAREQQGTQARGHCVRMRSVNAARGIVAWSSHVSSIGISQWSSGSKASRWGCGARVQSGGRRSRGRRPRDWQGSLQEPGQGDGIKASGV